MSDILTVAEESARQAGDFLRSHYGNITKVEKKGDRNFATNLDKEAEVMVIGNITSAFPGHSVIAEESGKTMRESEYLWIIDPLDGTHNFMRNINIYGVSIGVLKGGEFICGVIYMPETEEFYSSFKGKGAFKNGKQIFVSKTHQMNECSISFDSSIRYSPKIMLDCLGDLANVVFNVRMFGSSVRVLSYIAEGVLDFAVEFHDRPWDFAAGAAIIQEAGGKLTALNGGPLTYETIGYVVSNGLMHGAVQDLVLKQLNAARGK